MYINLGGYFFSNPAPLSFWKAPNCAGLYVIFVHDATAHPLPFREIYIGQSENLTNRGFFKYHKYSQWLRKSGSEKNLYIATRLMPNSADEERKNVLNELINYYHPVCNL